MMKLFINFILFQTAWFACVLGAANNLPWLGVLVTSVALAWHFYQAKTIKPEACLMLSALAIGGLYDQALLSLGLVDYANHGWSNAFVPVWILALWLAFASVLNVSLRWLHSKPQLATFFGAIGGPLAYIGAEKLGSVTLHGLSSLAALAVGWAIITPLLLIISERFDGFSEANTNPSLKSSI